MSNNTIKAKREKKSFFMQYSVEANIQASPEKVWSYLTNAAEYPNWNSTVVKVEGTIQKGNKIKVFAKISPDRAFPVSVSEFIPNQKMVWRGGMPLGLFKGIRTFQLTANDGVTHLKIWEDFSGLMLPLIGGTIPDLRPAFEDFAKDLKKVAEAR